MESSSNGDIKKGQLHHHHQSETKNWKLIHDPLLRKGLPAKLYRYNGIVPENPAYNVTHVSDPRSSSSKYFLRSEPTDLPVPNFTIDENYVGRPALRELAFFDLNDNVSETFLTDMCKKCGQLEEVKVFNHPTTKRRLGVARVVFKTEKEAAACLEKYNGTSVMGKTVNVVADPWGKEAKSAVDQLVNKSQTQTSSQDQPLPSSSKTAQEDEPPPSTSQLSGPSSIVATKPPNMDSAGRTKANANSSPAVYVPPPATPGVNGMIPDDPSSQSYASVATPYGIPPYPPPVYPMAPWPAAQIPPPPWAQPPPAIAHWPPPTWPVPLPANYAATATIPLPQVDNQPQTVTEIENSQLRSRSPSKSGKQSRSESKSKDQSTHRSDSKTRPKNIHSEDVASKKSSRNQKSSEKVEAKKSSRPSSRIDSRSVSRPSSRMDGHDGSKTRSRSHTRSDRSISGGRRRRSAVSPGPHRSGGREARSGDTRSRYWQNKKRGSSPILVDRFGKGENLKRRRSGSQDGSTRHSYSPKRRRKSHQRSSRSTESSSDVDSRRKKRSNREPTVESMDEEEYYRRSRTSSQQHGRRPTSRGSNGGASKTAALVGRAGVDSRKSGGSEYCDEIEEYEYYRRKRQRRRLVPSASSRGKDSDHQLQHKFEAITSSDEEDDRKSKGASSSGKKSHGRPQSSASDKFRNEISPPFGKLERISCSSDEESGKGTKRKARRKEQKGSGRRTASRNSDERDRRGGRSRRSRSSSSDSESSSGSKGRRGTQNRHQHRPKKRSGGNEIPVPVKKDEERGKEVKKAPVTKVKVPFEAPDSLETRIQQLLAGEQGQRNLDETGSTPLQDEHNASMAAAKAEKTSDVEMSLSSGDEEQCTPSGKPAVTKGAAPTPSTGANVVRPIAPYGNGSVPPPHMYYHPMYMYPPMGSNYIAVPPHMVPPPGYPPMWSQAYGHTQPIPFQPTPSPAAATPNLPQAKPKKSQVIVSVEQRRKKITQETVSEVKVALKAVLNKDIVKRAVETSVFQAVDAWYVKEEAEFKTRQSEEAAKRASAALTSLSQSLSSNVFDSRPSSEMTPTLTGVPGLGLRASLPKLPSFKRKMVKPSTPPRRDDRSESSRRSYSSSSSSSESSSESDDEKSRASSEEVVSPRRRQRLRSHALNSESERERSPSSSVERVKKRPRTPPESSRKPVVSSDEEDKEDEVKPVEDERRMEPISDEEIEDEPEPEAEDSMPSEDEAAAKRVPNVEERDDNEKTKIDTESEKEPEPEALREIPSPRAAKRIPQKRGRPRLTKVETTTEDDLVGQENMDVPKTPTAQESSETDEFVAPKRSVAREEGVMFMEDGAHYVPNEFDHHYTLRMGQLPPTPVPVQLSTPKPQTVLKSKQPTTIVAAQKKEKKEKEIKPPKPTRPAITFKARAEEDELRVFQEFLQSGVDEEDIGYFKMVYDQLKAKYPTDERLKWAPFTATAELSPTKRRLPPDEIPAHSTGCARTEGFYRLSYKEKRVKSRPRQALEYGEVLNQQNVNAAKQQVQISREARSMQRRLLATLGSEVDSELLKYNQLKFRKKQIKFSRSHIHGWGLFAMEDIAQDEMIVEYVGEKIRITMAEKREQKYEKMGVGSSYLFRIDNEMVVDATKRGNIARFINHSCNPNCYARIITVEGEKRIVIYSKQNISRGEEITYDYKFPLEDEKIPCTCGAPCCRGALN